MINPEDRSPGNRDSFQEREPADAGAFLDVRNGTPWRADVLRPDLPEANVEAPPAPSRPAKATSPSVEVGVFSSRSFHAALSASLSRAANDFDGGLIISTTLPYQNLMRLAGEDESRLKDFRVIDMVSAMDRNGFHDSGRVAYVSSPTLLEKVMLLAFEAVHSTTSGRNCIIVDSMSTLRFYNSDVALSQFAHRLTSLARMSDWGAMFLMNDHPDNAGLLERLAHLFDRVAPLPAAR